MSVLAGTLCELAGCLPLVAATIPQQQAPTVRVPCACPHTCSIVAPGRLAPWFRERGFTRPLRSLDRDFDARWSVETDDVEFAEALMRLPAARDAVTALARLGCQSLCLDGKHLTAVLAAEQKEDLKDSRHRSPVEAQLAILAGLCTELVRSRSFPHRTGHAWLFRGTIGAGVLLLALACTGFALWASELVEGAFPLLALRSLVVGLPLGIAVLAAAVVPLAGRSTSHKELGVLALVLLPAVAAACLAAALGANRLLDRGPATQHRLPVLERRERYSEKNLKGYWAIVPDWHGAAEATTRISFDKRRGEALVPGETSLLVRVSPGALGAERLLSTLVETSPH